jgi:hypothetical protein
MYACTLCDWTTEDMDPDHNGERYCPECITEVLEVAPGTRTTLPPGWENRLRKFNDFQLRKLEAVLAEEISHRQRTRRDRRGA